MASNSSFASLHNELQEAMILSDNEDLIKIVVGRHVQGTVTVTVTHDKLVFQLRDINIVDGPNKRKTLQTAQWNRETRFVKRFDSNPVND
jgi:hypothetical protein